MGYDDYGHEFSPALNPSCGETLLALQDKCATQRKLQEVRSFSIISLGATLSCNASNVSLAEGIVLIGRTRAD
jgi:hypothetical protein